MKNILEIEVTKPDNVLYIISGVSGSGKSTKARELLKIHNGGIIHNTDTVIEKTFGDYNKFFQEMIDKKDFSNLHKAHKINFNNFKKSVDLGIDCIINDNTNIKPWEPKEFVMYALNNGYDDKNIKIIDIGDGGLTAEELFERNVHNVPLEKIQSMIDSYKTHSPLTLEKIIEAKNPHDIVLYSGIILDEESRSKLINYFYNIDELSEDIKLFAHHMTICFGKGLPENLKQDLDKEIILKATHVGVSNTNLAVQVNGYFSENKIPHITISTKNNGKPVMSNDIVNWIKLPNEIELKGIIKEIKK